MREVINIPDTESGLHDNFQDFFRRLRAEVKSHMLNNTNLVCGPCELETIDMFLEAFKKGTIIPKGCGDLIDRNELDKLSQSDCIGECDRCGMDDGCFYNRAEVIVKANEEGNEECGN